MKNKTYGGYFNNPVVLILLLILICVGGYFLLNKNSFNTQILQETQPTINTTPTNTNTTQATQNSLFEKQQSCSKLLNDLENRLKTENYKTTDFIVGYSPSFNSCISGYTAKDLNYKVILYTIVNLNTNQVILPAFLPTEYTEYKVRLSELTNGQINK